MSKAYLLQHDELFGPGLFQTMFRDFGIPVEIRRLDKGDEVPADLDEVRLLVLLGGRMRVSETASHPFIEKEIAIAKQMIEADRMVVGTGFGCELLAQAGGGKVMPITKPGPDKDTPGPATMEVGLVPHKFPFPGGTEPAVFGMVDNTPLFCWNRDTFTIPALPPPANPPPPPARPPTGNVVMAVSRLQRSQAWRFKNRCFGFHFHLELESAQMKDIVSTLRTQLAEFPDTPRGEDILSSIDTLGPKAERSGAKLIQNLIQFLRVY